MLDTLLLRSSLHFTPLHYTCRHFTSSHLNFTQLHFTTLSFGLTTFKFPTAPFHLTSLYFTSLHFTALLDDDPPPKKLLHYLCERNYTQSIWHSHMCEPNFHSPATERPLDHEDKKAQIKPCLYAHGTSYVVRANFAEFDLHAGNGNSMRRIKNE
jgi:hypothetical protein